MTASPPETSMVERMARAICEASGRNPDDPLFWNERTGQVIGVAWRGYEWKARAAIAALREPTEAMLADGDSAIPRFEADAETGARMMGREGALECWRTMIDAALEGK